MGRVAGGSGTSGESEHDVLTCVVTEGALAQVEAQIPVLEAGLDAAMNALDVLLGVQPGTYRAELSPATPVPVAPGLAETGTPGEMIRRRPDLIVAARRLAAAHARIGVAISEYYPKLSLGALLGSATTISSGNLFTGDASQALGVLGLRWRLFDSWSKSISRMLRQSSNCISGSASHFRAHHERMSHDALD